MKKIFKWLRVILVSLIVLVVIALASVYIISNKRINKLYEVDVASLDILTDEETIARGKHIAIIRGCLGCHKENGAGGIFIDSPVIANLYASNLTSGKGGIGQYSDDDWVRAIRHAVAPDDKPLLFMPSYEYNALGKEDLAALIAYFQSLPAVDNELANNKVGPLGRILFLAGQFPLVPAEQIDHAAAIPQAPKARVSVDYGEYLATSCIGCHGESFSGGVIPGTPPETPMGTNLTPDKATGLGTWTEADFITALRKGKLPDGSELNPFMPWQDTKEMTNKEIRALWLYFQSLPPLAEGNR